MEHSPCKRNEEFGSNIRSTFYLNIFRNYRIAMITSHTIRSLVFKKFHFTLYTDLLTVVFLRSYILYLECFVNRAAMIFAYFFSMRQTIAQKKRKKTNYVLCFILAPSVLQFHVLWWQFKTLKFTMNSNSVTQISMIFSVKKK